MRGLPVIKKHGKINCYKTSLKAIAMGCSVLCLLILRAYFFFRKLYPKFRSWVRVWSSTLGPGGGFRNVQSLISKFNKLIELV